MTADSGYRRDGDVVVFSVVFLFFFQLLREFIEGIYAFGLLGTDIPPEIASVVLLFSPVVLLFWSREMKPRAPLVLTIIILLSRLIAVMLDTRWRMLLAGVGVAASLVWFPSRLRRSGQEDTLRTQHQLSLGLIIAVLLSILLRVLGSGLDVSTHDLAQLVGWLLAALAVSVAIRRPREQSRRQVPISRLTLSFGTLTLLALGITSVFILLYFAFTSPNVVARWTEANYPATVAVLALGMALVSALVMQRPSRLTKINTGLVWMLNGLFVFSLVVTLWSQQIAFPASAGGYPLFVSDVSFVRTLPPYLMLLLSPVIFLDFALYVQRVINAQPSLRALGGAFTLSALYLLLMIFGHVFTTVYDYIPVIGPAFRDRFWLVHLVAGLGLMLPLITIGHPALMWTSAPAWANTLLVLGVVTTGAAFVPAARPEPAVPGSPLTILTYNIQQGYDEAGQKAAEDQLAVMRAAGPDIIGLQESDTNRIAGGNADLVRYYADALGMHSYYGPTPVAGTFGIALLSKVPIENPRTFYMFSEGEQTAAIAAQITINQVTYSVFVTHLGNDGPIVQQKAVLKVVAGKENVILMGDFNFRPDTDQYNLTTAALDDAWLKRWPGGVDDTGAEPLKRIDHFFISPELQVEDVRYINSPASDHPAVTLVLTP